MARHRKIDVRVWVDEKFCSLSAPPPNGQTLWFYLLTNPDTVNIPGLYRAGEMAMAEALNWPLKGFRKAFQEVAKRKMVAADWRARVVWVPKAITYSRPESPNVVRSWRQMWDEIPECPLKVFAYWELKAFVEGLGEGFREAFGEACPQPSPNQEQEQEKSQEQDQERISARARERELKAWFEEVFVKAYPEHRQGTQITSARNFVAGRLRPDEAKRSAILEHLEAWKRSAEWLKDGGEYVPGLMRFFDKGCHERMPQPRERSNGHPEPPKPDTDWDAEGRRAAAHVVNR